MMNLVEALQRLGIALVAGVLVGLVPFCLGRIRGPRRAAAVLWGLASLLFAGLAAAFIWYLWIHEIPHPEEPAVPETVEVLETL